MTNRGFLITSKKDECFGCEACSNSCPKSAIFFEEDDEGFRYPRIDFSLCIACKVCENVCPFANMPKKNAISSFVFGGYSLNQDIRFMSTSGGAFSEIVDAFCDDDYAIFGAVSDGLLVKHSCVFNKNEIAVFRKSKYSQSVIGDSYKKAKGFLKAGKKVLFSGTPCQIAGLISCLGDIDKTRLLTVEVVCEGVPSPLYMRKYDEKLHSKYGYGISKLDYRYTGKSVFGNGKWDFEIMETVLENDKVIRIDRWFNPFWSIWLQHLMSRPSCYNCQFTEQKRLADITLGDLWGVHSFSAELYGKNSGSSLVVCNSKKGRTVFDLAKENMFGHELDFNEVLKFQGPFKRHIAENDKRNLFMQDLKSNMSFRDINKKWAKRPTFKLLLKKYIWGNRQAVFFHNLFRRK